MENEIREELKFKSKLRDEKNVRDIQNRLSRVMGQIGGIKKMIEEGRYCADIIIQVSACEKALTSVSDILLKEHLETCVVSSIKNGETDVVPETLYLIQKMR